MKFLREMRRAGSLRAASSGGREREAGLERHVGLAAHVVVVLDAALGRQPVVVPAHRVEDVQAAHALVAREHVRLGVAEDVADVERPRHGGRRRVDHEGGLWLASSKRWIPHSLQSRSHFSSAGFASKCGPRAEGSMVTITVSST